MQMQEISPLFGDDVNAIFDARRSLASRRAIGSPSPTNVAARIVYWRKHLSKGA
jgi:argininosuccinate lyase